MNLSEELRTLSFNFLKSLDLKESLFFDAYLVLKDCSSVYFSNVTRDFLIAQYEYLEVYGISQFYFNFSRRGD